MSVLDKLLQRAQVQRRTGQVEAAIIIEWALKQLDDEVDVLEPPRLGN